MTDGAYSCSMFEHDSSQKRHFDSNVFYMSKFNQTVIVQLGLKMNNNLTDNRQFRIIFFGTPCHSFRFVNTSCISRASILLLSITITRVSTFHSTPLIITKWHEIF